MRAPINKSKTFIFNRQLWQKNTFKTYPNI